MPTARPPTPERFDAYVSVRSGADLGNKANLNSPEQVISTILFDSAATQSMQFARSILRSILSRRSSRFLKNSNP